jgi:hypothetical protein
VAAQASEIMGKWEDEIIGRRVNGMMSIKLKTRREYFNFANLEGIFMNDIKKLLYSIITLADRLRKKIIICCFSLQT